MDHFFMIITKHQMLITASYSFLKLEKLVMAPTMDVKILKDQSIV